MATIDILITANSASALFTSNDGTVTTPVQLGHNDPWENDVQFTTQHANVESGQGTGQLAVKVQEGDVIRWWDTTLDPDNGYDMVMVNFTSWTNWTDYLTTPVANTETVARAKIQSGYGTDKIAYDMAAYADNYVETTVKSGVTIPSTGVSIGFDLTLAKVDVKTVGSTNAVGYYSMDPSIHIYPSVPTKVAGS